MRSRTLGWLFYSCGFADKEMTSSDHIDYFLLCLMDDDRTSRKSSDDMAECYRVIFDSTSHSIIHLFYCIRLSTLLFYMLSHFEQFSQSF